jgi:hypothetical protein
MNTYEISCYSKCGGRFEPYFLSVTVLANSETEAIGFCEEWLALTGKKPVHPASWWIVKDVTNQLNWSVEGRIAGVVTPARVPILAPYKESK